MGKLSGCREESKQLLMQSRLKTTQHNDPQQQDTHMHIYTTQVKGLWKQIESLLCGKLQKGPN